MSRKLLVLLVTLISFTFLFIQETSASVASVNVTYELNGGTNHPNNPITYTEFDDFYFREASKEGFQFIGWFLNLNDPNSRVTRSIQHTSGSITLYAKFDDIYQITVNPNNQLDPYELSVQKEIKSQNNLLSQNVSIISSLILPIPQLFSGITQIYNMTSAPANVYARLLNTSDNLQIGTLPNPNIKLVDFKVINSKVYVFGMEHNSANGIITLHAIEIDNINTNNRTTEFPNIASITYQKPSSEISIVNMEVVDFNKDGKFEIFLKWSTAKVASTSNRYAIVAHEFDPQSMTFTKSIDHVVEAEINDFTFFDLNSDGFQELIATDINKLVRIYQYNNVNATFDIVLKTIDLSSISESIYTNSAIGNSLFVGHILGGKQVYISFLINNGTSNFSSLSISYFGIDEDLEVNQETPVGSKLAQNVLEYSNQASFKGVQMDEYGLHAFSVYAFYTAGLGKSIHSVITKNINEDTFKISTQNTAASESRHFIQAYFDGEKGYIHHPAVDKRLRIITFSNALTFPNISVTKEGYQLEGWYTTEDFQQVSKIATVDTVDSDLTVYAKWNASQFTVNFSSNGGSSISPSSTFVVFDTLLSEPTEPTRNHFRFLGWIPQGETEFYDFTTPYNFPSNKTFVAQWENQVYEITHITNTDQTIDNHEANSFTLYTLPTNLSKVGHTFEGWYTTSDFSTTKLSSMIQLIYGDMTLYAKWTANNYDIEFILPDGSIYDKETFAFGADITGLTLPETNPEVEGTTFTGWETTDLTTMPAETIELSMLFTPKSYDLVYETNGGNAIATTQVAFHSELDLIIPTRTGYSFSGWFSDQGLTTSFALQNMPAESITLYANWTISDYTLTFNSNEGTSVASIIQDFATTVTAPANPTRTGYTFGGWFSDEALTTSFTFDTMPGSDTTLYAKWTANRYTITFDSNEGTSVAAITQNYATSITAPANPTRPGYTFDGWSLAVPETMPAEDLTLTATWLINQYSLTFNSNEGTSVAAITQDYATTVTAPANPTRSGYTFNGWFSDEALTTSFTFDTMPASDTTLYAKWTINGYTITFNSNEGTSVAAITQDYATTVTAPEAPSRVGYTFSGWYRDEALTTTYTFDTMPASDTTIYAKWDTITYTITFELYEGTLGVNQVTTYTVESESVVLLESTKEGHVFQGYYLETTFETFVSTILPTEASNLTVYALFFTTAFETYLEAVNDLPNPLSIEDKETIESYLTTYDTFSVFEQGYVDRSRLVVALDTIITLEVERVKDAIDALSNQVSLSDEADLEAARALYEALTPQQQSEVSNLSTLETREDALEVLKVETLITSIPLPINTNSEDAIHEAKEALDALTSELKEAVSNEDILNELIALLEIVQKIDALLNEADPTKEQLRLIQEQIQTLSDDPISKIDETLYRNYLLLEEEMTASSIWVFLGGGFSLLSLLGYLYYRYRKIKQKA